MSAVMEKQPIVVISACMRVDGHSTFARTQVEVTPEETENGVHFYLAEAELMLMGFEEPYVHFTEPDAPAFLFPAVELFLGVTPEPLILAYAEKT